jgi:protease I
MELTNKRVAVVAEDMFHDIELWYPVLRFREAGANVQVVAPDKGKVYKSKSGVEVTSDVAAADVRAEDFDAIIIPGGFAPDFMRRNAAILKLVKDAYNQNKVVAAICHAGWVLISANIIRGKKVTSFIAIKDDMVNAGGKWVDEEVVRDGNLITSRTPKDLPAFCREIIKALSGS